MAQYFRTATPMGDWRTLKAVCADSNGHDVGDLVLIEDTVGLVFLSVPPLDADGCLKDPAVQFEDEFVLVYHIEKVIVAKESGSTEAAAKGQKVYWSGTNGDPVTTVWTSGYYWIGIVTEDADATATEVEIDLKGDKATLLE